ncbi:hypothetical protein SAMD00019534_074020 [Acytostelium subglobosum LB1]|uniref:hypothetical protein n=1 Tax=Acytostelium subglobosum LB1 TaxID=1410327 RepID=UPI00064510C2|nr:hypothetical protein SAMD00019534_074020 [Acytostelium subglobosum LB1]GAM24227.1 hypothetical protein SAMD00019534_074020 [Acytostelium subglobosum LB1]|eukprot:XP_012752553.1 hypothetical protein SAMD00019534_074020 [Acytostelium subglobosum LB1]
MRYAVTIYMGMYIVGIFLAVVLHALLVSDRASNIVFSIIHSLFHILQDSMGATILFASLCYVFHSTLLSPIVQCYQQTKLEEIKSVLKRKKEEDEFKKRMIQSQTTSILIRHQIWCNPINTTEFVVIPGTSTEFRLTCRSVVKVLVMSHCSTGHPTDLVNQAIDIRVFINGEDIGPSFNCSHAREFVPFNNIAMVTREPGQYTIDVRAMMRLNTSQGYVNGLYGIIEHYGV